jgi:hypothetical protein
VLEVAAGNDKERAAELGGKGQRHVGEAAAGMQRQHHVHRGEEVSATATAPVAATATVAVTTVVTAQRVERTGDVESGGSAPHPAPQPPDGSAGVGEGQSVPFDEPHPSGQKAPP